MDSPHFYARLSFLRRCVTHKVFMVYCISNFLKHETKLPPEGLALHLHTSALFFMMYPSLDRKQHKLRCEFENWLHPSPRELRSIMFDF